MRIVILEVLGAVVALAGVGVLFCGGRAQTTARHGPAPPEAAMLEQRSRVKFALARRLIAERPPLLAAAEWFEQVNGEDGTETLVRSVPGRSVREKLCRQVILYVIAVEGELRREGSLPTGPRASEELQAEFDRRLAAGEFPPEPGMQ
ncbi:MAG: hypothetical protein J0I06_13000 [Planctomycetes bacterium]|nr:hypothetical protein [Planctomycetota bacterium]